MGHRTEVLPPKKRLKQASVQFFYNRIMMTVTRVLERVTRMVVVVEGVTVANTVVLLLATPLYWLPSVHHPLSLQHVMIPILQRTKNQWTVHISVVITPWMKQNASGLLH